MTARGGKKIAKSALRHDIVDRGMNDEKYVSGTWSYIVAIALLRDLGERLATGVGGSDYTNDE